jgi:hypothetical protein
MDRQARQVDVGDSELCQYSERALSIWPRLDRKALSRCACDPNRIVRLVARRSSLPIEAVLALLIGPTASPLEIGSVLSWPATPAQVERAMALVPDKVVQLITASGTPDECRAKVREYVEAGCTCPILYPLGDVPATIEAFAGGKY